ncbi:SubName: Full=Uncharacterized protein {ECO:0000313/EMBL:CCA66826.1} [Serendipita indica DSM 11827]|uniref:Uncharacterized protein n=1 Tax=Serendipita indica (strain DSM 11827) TaxID=1109443 RepID=G4T6A7_SERID|nr:SubName: Full=Uncharacterized protein {ECO:0000313/EMBL:CCA66826.1} [Serendipita indica DSM 11827]CCA66826.1 hypothetical protein PIIN_00588 [Serendipita indica DSM 11827]
MLKNALQSIPDNSRQVFSTSSASSEEDPSRTPPRVRSPVMRTNELQEPECIRQKHFAAKAKAKRRYSQYQASVMRQHPGPMPSPFFTFTVESRVVKKPRVSAPSTMSPFLQAYPHSDASYKTYGAIKPPTKRSKYVVNPADLPSSDDLAAVTLHLQNDEDDEMMHLDDDESPTYQLEDPFNY